MSKALECEFSVNLAPGTHVAKLQVRVSLHAKKITLSSYSFSSVEDGT